MCVCLICGLAPGLAGRLRVVLIFVGKTVKSSKFFGPPAAPAAGFWDRHVTVGHAQKKVDFSQVRDLISESLLYVLCEKPIPSRKTRRGRQHSFSHASKPLSLVALSRDPSAARDTQTHRPAGPSSSVRKRRGRASKSLLSMRLLLLLAAHASAMPPQKISVSFYGESG